MTSHAIAMPLASDAQALVDILGEHWIKRRRWPVHDYLDRVLRDRVGFSAIEVTSRLPVAFGRAPHSGYRLVFVEHGGPIGKPDERVGLTIAGLYHLPATVQSADQLITVVRFLAAADAALEPDPDRPVSLDLPLQDLLSNHLRLELRGWSDDALALALEQEPPLWGCLPGGPSGRSVHVDGGRLALFRSVDDVDDYLARVIRLLGADRKEVDQPALVAPMALPEALGYLDAVWRVTFGTALLGRGHPAAWAKLALPCASTDELDARLSALADTLGRLDVDLPGEEDAASKAASERSLARLRRKMTLGAPDPSASRAGDAISTLQTIVRIRAGGQHSLGAQTAQAYASLGIPYPPTDPGAAWDGLRSAATAAINAIREEIQSTW